MTPNAEDLLRRYAAAAAGEAQDGAPAADAAEAWTAIRSATGRLGAARLHDSARRRWIVEAHRDRPRGRFLVVRPVHGDNEPFRASADGHRPDAYLRISESDWTVLALFVWAHEGDDGRADGELATEALRVLSRIVIEAQHQGLMGAADDEDDDA